MTIMKGMVCQNQSAEQNLQLRSQLACLHVQSKSGFLEDRLFSSQSGLCEKFSDCSDWLDKSQPSKKATFVLIM